MFGTRYSSLAWERNKKLAEQAAASVCLLDLGLMAPDGTITQPAST